MTESTKVSKSDIQVGLEQVGISAGFRLIVHSSLKSFGVVEGGSLTVIQALMDTVTTSGTIMMPSFNHGQAFSQGAEGIYDPKNTQTINGAIPDLFWRLPGVHRSLNPTHAFAAWGKDAIRYVKNHHRTLTMGPNSPLGLLWQDGGWGLLLGVGMKANTFQHVVEMTTGAPCLGLRTEAYPVRTFSGRIVLGRTWGWREQECPLMDQTRYQAEMEKRGLLCSTTIGRCKAILFRLQDCYDVIEPLLSNGLGALPPCSRCPIRPRQTPQTVPSDWDPIQGHLQKNSPAWTT